MRRAKASAAELPVELVEEIFLRLDDVADLVRASAACTAFRRVVSNDGFLRRFRSLHRPPVVGLISSRLCFHPAEEPRRSAQAARAVARDADFSSSSFPANPYQAKYYWHIRDVRDGRVLVSSSWKGMFFSSLVVYDPLHRTHVLIPPIPNDMVGVACKCTTTQKRHCRCYCNCHCEFDPFLVPANAAADGNDDDDLSFQVMCTVVSEGSHVLQTFVYSSVTGKWHGVASLSIANNEPIHYHYIGLMKRYYAHGCFYWLYLYQEDMLVLDINEMKFSVVRLPPGTEDEDKVVVKASAEEDKVVLLVLCENTLHLYRKASGGSANDCWQWRHDDVVITLLDIYEWFFGGTVDADQGYALLQGVPRYEVISPKTNAHYFTVELQTMLVEELCVSSEFNTEPAFLYASFPPPFATPSI